MSKKSKKILFKILKILGKILGVLLLLFILLVLFVRSPWGQGIIVDKAVSYVKDKTNTEVRIDKLFVTFDGNISLDGLYLEDTQGDTLVFSKHLEAEIPLWSVITGGPISVDDVTWEGVRANVVRKDSITGYNYQFLIDAFAATDTTSVQPAPTAQDTTALQLNLGTFDFTDIQLNYADQVTGMQANLNLGALEVQMQETNLEEMLFDIGDSRLANTKVVYKQTKPIAPSADTTEVPLPILRIGELVVEDVTFDYASTPDGIAADGTLAVLETHIPQIDLKNNTIEVEDFVLKNSVVNLALQTVEKQETEAEALPETSQELWPPFTVAV
ncbi:MAG: translocation/assembly module TamB, partial [Bacteroidota bacterium]|nr:translocation/assembly module TamB [Bacteroidota bacterium]